MKETKRYTLDLTDCLTAHDVYIAIEADLNARKQLSEINKAKKPWYKRLF